MKAAAWVLALVPAVVPAVAHAQPDATPQPRSLEIYAGAVAIGSVDFGQSRATLTANQTSAPDFTLFVSDTSIGTSVGFDGRVAFNVTRALAVEGGFVWTRPQVESRITSDVEGIPDVTVTQDLDTYFFEGSAVFHLPVTFAGGRGVPFLMGGAGYLRQLDDESLLVDSGAVFHGGGGVKILFTPRVGIRADGRLYIRRAGLELEDVERRSTWGVSGGLLVRF